MKKIKGMLTESERQADSIKRQKAIVESFSNEFNKIKRTNEDDVDDLKLVSFINENRNLADVRAKAYRESPEAAEMTDFVTQHKRKLKELHDSFTAEGGEIGFIEFAVFIFKNAQDLVMDPTMNEMGGSEEMEGGMSEESIYINQGLADNFDFPYQNDGEKVVINSNTLRDSNSEWDTAHMQIFDKYSGQDLLLQGKGYGWWNVLKGVGGMNEQDPIGEINEEEYDRWGDMRRTGWDGTYDDDNSSIPEDPHADLVSKTKARELGSFEDEREFLYFNGSTSLFHFNGNIEYRDESHNINGIYYVVNGDIYNIEIIDNIIYVLKKTNSSGIRVKNPDVTTLKKVPTNMQIASIDDYNEYQRVDTERRDGERKTKRDELASRKISPFRNREETNAFKGLLEQNGIEVVRAYSYSVEIANAEDMPKTQQLYVSSGIKANVEEYSNSLDETIINAINSGKKYEDISDEASDEMTPRGNGYITHTTGVLAIGMDTNPEDGMWDDEGNEITDTPVIILTNNYITSSDIDIEINGEEFDIYSIRNFVSKENYKKLSEFEDYITSMVDNYNDDMRY